MMLLLTDGIVVHVLAPHALLHQKAEGGSGCDGRRHSVCHVIRHNMPAGLL